MGETMVNRNSCRECGTDIDADERFCEKHKPKGEKLMKIKIVINGDVYDKTLIRDSDYESFAEELDKLLRKWEVLKPQWINGQQIESV
jgi:hypothetical protein